MRYMAPKEHGSLGAFSSLFYQFSIIFLTFFQIKGTKWGDFAPILE